jgi:hypothetical protein
VLKRGLHAGFLLGARKAGMLIRWPRTTENRPEIRSIVPLGRAIFLMPPGTSCLATIRLSLWDKIHSPR